jgi:tetratricopeptide (TPR) repeat protein
MTRRQRYITLFAHISLFIILATPQALSQFHLLVFQNNKDTLYLQLKKAPSAALPNLYNRLAFHYSFYQADSAFYYASKAKELAKRRNDRFEIAMANRHMGNAYSLSSDYRNSIRHLQEAMSIFKEMDHRRGLLETLHDLSRVSYDAGLYTRVMELIGMIEQLLDENRYADPPLITPLEQALSIGLRGIACREAREYERGIGYFREYIELAGKTKVPDAAHEIYLASMGETFGFAGKTDSALKYILLAQDFMPRNRNKPPDLHEGYEFHLGGLYIELGEPGRAIPYLHKSLNDNRQRGAYRYSALTACDLGDIYTKFGLYDSAIYYYRVAKNEAGKFLAGLSSASLEEEPSEIYSGYQYFYNISGLMSREIYYRLMVRVCQNLYRYYRKVDNLTLAADQHEILLLYNDSLNTSMNNLEFHRMQLQFDVEQVEQANVLLQRENELKESRIRQNRMVIWSVGAISLLALAFFVVLFRQSRLKNIQEKILLEQRLLRAQMNPHFIFNSLASIQNLIFQKDDIKAGIYLSRFSELVRSILEHSRRDAITLAEEITTIRNYLELQKIRFLDRFEYSISLDDRIDDEVQEIPPMLAQPFIENAIEHGFRQKEGMGKLDIRYLYARSAVVIEVEDNGIGRQKAQEITRQQDGRHRSLATVITRERIATLNRKSNNKITLEITDLTGPEGNAAGTLVRFEIPNG